MKVLFICGALEPGRDGVGDYTRCLSTAVQSAGHQTSVIALFDPYITEEIILRGQDANESFVTVRIPATASNAFRYRLVKQWTQSFDPEWISLQYVPYAFNPKGLPFLLGSKIKSLLRPGMQQHIMFHETWIGHQSRLEWKRRIISFLQKGIIRQMVRQLRPNVVHTQLPDSREKLRQFINPVECLPLFSNISIEGNAPKANTSIVRIGFFSQASASPAIVSFLGALHSNLIAAGKTMELLFIGGNPTAVKKAGEAFGKTGWFANRIRYTGFLPPAEISAALQTCSLGVTQVPRHALGKSGSVAAFLEHGVPVAAPVVLAGISPENVGFFSETLCRAILVVPSLEKLALATQAATHAKKEIGLLPVTSLFLTHLASNTMHHAKLLH